MRATRSVRSVLRAASSPVGPVLCCLAMLLAAAGWSAAEVRPLATLTLEVTGSGMAVSPARLSVPKGIAGSVGVVVRGGIPPGAFVEAYLRGPSFPARRLVGAPDRPLMLPPLNLVGDYSLDGIRLVMPDGAVVLEGTPGTVPVQVFDEILVSRVTSRPLSLTEIEEKGIDIDQSNFRAVEFEVGFVLESGETVRVSLPVVAPDFRQNTEVIPAAELEERLRQAEAVNDRLSESLVLPKQLEGVMPNIQIKAMNIQYAKVGEEDLALDIPPIPALMVIPGNIGFLNQFFSVMIYTENAAPQDSGLSVRDLLAELVLPLGPDAVAGTHASPGDDPLRFARINGSVRNIVPVKSAGPDGKPGSADDTDRLRPGETGQGELLVEGLQEGLHVMEMKLTGTMDGLAAGPVAITGKAAASVMVRNPKFSMAFTHPRTTRAGEPYEASVTILNTSSTVANLVSVELNANNVSGGILESPARVELGTIAPGETRSAVFRIRSQKTGSITFSNLTTSDDSVIGRFRLKAGVDERGVALSSDTLALPDFIDQLPPPLVVAAQRVLGQALSVNSAGQLPPGVLRVSRSLVRGGNAAMPLRLLEAAQRVRYGDPLVRVLPDLALDWQGARDTDVGWDQIMRSTDAGREWREAMAAALQDASAGDMVQRISARARDFAGRGESWMMACSDRAAWRLSWEGAAGVADDSRSTAAKTLVYGGSQGQWLVAAGSGKVRWKASEAVGPSGISVMFVKSDGDARELRWSPGAQPAGTVLVYDPEKPGEELSVDSDGDGVTEQVLAASGSDIAELPPEVVAVLQDPEVLVGRPSEPCPIVRSTDERDKAVDVRNYGNVLAVLFSKPMTQEKANVPSAYRLEDGNEAAFVQMQPGGRLALLTMRSPVGAVVSRSLTVAATVADARGNPVIPAARPLRSRLVEGSSVKGRVMRADGSFAANVPVTLTYNDEVATFDGGCLKWVRRVSQVRTDDTGAFRFDMVLGGIPFSLSTTDTSGLSEEAVKLILESAVKGQVDAAKLAELASLPANRNTLLAEFAMGALPEAIAKAEGLDRAVVNDKIPAARFGSESSYSLRFRGRGIVTGQVLLADGITPAISAAVNLFPDVGSRELGRGVLTDSAGRFSFPGVPLGNFTIEAANADRLTRTVSGLLDGKTGVADLKVVLGSERTKYANWRGRVTMPDGSAAPGALVYVARMPPEGAFIGNLTVFGQTTSDAAGFWSLENIPTGDLAAIAFPPDGKGGYGRRGPFSVNADETITANIVLPARASVSGVVRFANGDPVAGAVVGGGQELATTDALGRFVLPGVPTGQSAVTAGFVGIENDPDPRRQLTRLQSQTLQVQPGAENFVSISFPAKGRIIGKVRDAFGNPVPNVNVALPFPNADTSWFVWTKADEEGNYEFPGLDLRGPIGGAYDVSAPAPPAEEPFDGDAAAAALKEASAEEVAAIIGKAFAAFTGVNNPFLNGEGENFNPTVYGFREGVKLDFDGETETADIRYLGTSKISGIVKNGQGVPIGARVRLTGIGPDAIGKPGMRIRAERNSDPALGTFEFNGQAFVGDWGLQAASPFFPVVLSTSGKTTTLDPDVPGIVLQFPPVAEINGSLSGRVLMPDGSPAGAGIEVSIAAGSDDPRVLRTDAEGRFSTGAALYSLRGNTGYEVTAFDPLSGGRAQAGVNVLPSQDNLVTLTLLGRGKLSVLVRKADGSPAVAAQVKLSRGAFPQERLEAVSGPDGTVEFANLFEGPYAVSAATTIGLTRVAGAVGTYVERNGSASAVVTLSSTGTINGRFLESDGVTPVAGANIRLGDFAFAPTDPQGRFSFVDVPLGTHVLLASNPVNGRGGNASVTLASNGEARDVRIIETPLGTVSGLVIDSAGTSTVPGALVVLEVDDPFALTRKFTVTSGPDGSYSVAGVPAGGFTVKASSAGVDGSVRALLPATTAELSVDVPLSARATLVVRVLRSGGAGPADSAEVKLFRMVGGQPADRITTRDTAADGSAEFPGLPLGEYALQAFSSVVGESRDRSLLKVVSLSGRGERAEQELVLRGIGSLAGRVLKAGGGVASGAEVTISIPTSPGDQVTPIAENLVVGDDGAFSFANLPPGLRVMLRATRLGLAAAETVETVIAGETVTRDLTLTPSGTVKGRILREDGTTVAVGAEALVTFPSRSGAEGTIVRTVGADGLFELAPVPQGDWTLRALLPANGGLALRSGSITANDEIDDIGDLVLDESPPRVTSTVPADTEEGVDIHASISLRFSEALDPASVVPGGIFLREASGGTVVAASLTQTGPAEWLLDPVEPLKSETSYRIIVVDGVLRNALGAVTNSGPLDLVGRPLTTLFSASFTTRDQRPPQLLSFTPAEGTEQVDPRTPVRLSFDEILQPGAAIVLTGPSGPVPGTVSLGVNGRVLTFVSTTDLPVNAELQVVVSGVRDLAGNEVANQPLVASFRTLDTLGPAISSVRIKGGANPTAGSTAVLESLLAAPETGDFRVRYTLDFTNVGTSAAGSTELAVTMPPAGDYTVRAIAIDRFGNEGPFAEFALKVRANDPPTIRFVRLNPAAGAVAGGSGFSLRVEAEDDGAVTDLRAAATGAATVALKTSAGAPLVLQGVVPLDAVPGGRIRVLATAKDDSGAETGDQVFEIEVSDGAPPVIAIADPAPGASVAPGPFTLAVDWRDNSGAADLSVTLGAPVDAVLSRSVSAPANLDSRETFGFDLSDLEPVGGSFTATVVATDAVGKTATTSRSFTIPDLTPPRLVSIVPADGSSNASLWTDWTVEYGEAASAAMLAAENYSLADPAGEPLAFALQAVGPNTVRIRPNAPLKPGVSHTLRLLPGLTDAAGNRLADASGNAMPAGGFAFSLTSAAVTAVTPVVGAKFIPGQTIPALALFESGIGATSFRFSLNGGTPVTTSAKDGGQGADLILPADATEAVLRFSALLDGRPAYEHPPVVLDLRPRDADDDGDGWGNGFEADRGMDPFVANSDGDDFDNDGLSNGGERTAGTDPAKRDCDDDGLTDGAEVALGTNPLNPDSDGDAYADNIDPKPVDPALPGRPVPSGMLAWWKFDDDLLDAGRLHPATGSNAAFVAGKAASGLKLGADGFVEVADSPRLRLQQFSVEGWVRPDGPGPSEDSFGSVIFTKQISNVSASISLSWTQAGKFIVTNSGSSATSSGTFPAGTFHHVAVTCDGTIVRLFVNGRIEAEFAQVAPTPYNDSFDWTIGANPRLFHPAFTRTFNGVIDDLAIYGRALTHVEVVSLRVNGNEGLGKPGSQSDADADLIADIIDPDPAVANRAPVGPARDFTINRGENLSLTTAQLLAGVSDPDGDTLSIDPNGLSFPVGGFAFYSGSALFYSPMPGFSGVDSFTYSVEDRWGLSASIRISVSVNANTRPTAGSVQSPGASLSFDGNDFASVVHSAAFDEIEGAAGVTFESWMFVRGYPQGFAVPFDKYEATNDWGWHMAVQNNPNGLTFYPDRDLSFASGVLPQPGAWRHLAMTFDQTSREAVFYVDGNEVSRKVTTAGLRDTAGEALYLGYSPSGADEFTDGLLAEVRLWKRLLTAEEIRSGMGRQATGVETGLAAAWPLDDGAGSSAISSVAAVPAADLASGSQAPSWSQLAPPLVGRGQAVTAMAGSLSLIALEASDMDFQPLSAKILALPSKGRIFQFTAGGIGSRILVPGTVVTDPKRRIIYSPDDEFTGLDRLVFAASDGFMESEPAVLRITVSAEGGSIASDDVWDLSRGTVVTESTADIGQATQGSNAFDGGGSSALFGSSVGSHSISWETAGPVMVEGAVLRAFDEGVAGRGFTEARLYGRKEADTFYDLLAVYKVPENPYFGGELMTIIPFKSFVGSKFRIDFDKVDPSIPGPEIVEIDAIGESVVMVPSPEQIELQNATADRSQAGFPPSMLIDGILVGGQHGWAGDVGGTPPMTAVFETKRDIGADPLTVFTFTLPQLYGSAHFLGNFRISATTDDRSQFADGLANGGDVSAVWTPLEVVEITGTGGETLQVLGDGSVLAGGNMPDTTTYTVTARGISGNVTGFRLEVLEHPSLPNNGPGRAGHGNWVLSEFLVSHRGGVSVPNRAPRGTPDALVATQSFPATTADVLANDTDPDNDPITLVDFAQPSRGTVVSNGNGTFTYTSDPSFSGTDSFTYRVTDGFQIGKPVTVTVTVNPSNVVAWSNPAGGDWNTATNWTPARVPSGTDRAVIELAGTYTVTLPSGTASFASLSVGGAGASVTLRQTGGILAPQQPSVFLAGSNYRLEGGELSGAGSLTIAGGFDWFSGILRPGGRLILDSGSVSAFGSGSLKWIDRIVENKGMLTYAGGEWKFNNQGSANGRLENLVGGTLVFDGDGDIGHWNGGSNAINNAGLVIRRGAGTTTIASVPFNNLAGGIVRIEAGVLDLPVGMILAGTWQRVGGELRLRNAGFVVAAGAVFDRQDFTLTEGSLTFPEDRTIDNLTMIGNCDLHGAGNVTVTGSFTWTSGALQPGGKLILAAGSTSVFGPGGRKWTDRVVENGGTVTYNGGDWSFNLNTGNNGRFENLAGGTLIFEGDGDIGHWNGGVNAINNAGLVIRRGTGATTVNNVPFNNLAGGTVRMEEGALEIPVTTTLAGTWQRQGGELVLRNAGYTIPAAAVFDREDFTITNGSLSFPEDRTVANLTMIGNCDLHGAGDVTVTGAFTWSSGALYPGGKLILAAGSTSVFGPGGRKWTDRVVENSGTVTYNGGEWYFNINTSNNGRFENLAGGTLILDGEGDIGHWNGGVNAINNAGLVIRRGAGTTTIGSVPLNNLATGTVQMEAGVLDLPVNTTLAGTWQRQGGELGLRNAGYTIAAGAVFDRQDFTVTNGSIAFPEDRTVANLTMIGNCDLHGAGDVTVTGAFTWSSGALFPGGKLILAAGSTSVFGPGGRKWTDRVVENSGIVTYNGGDWYFNINTGNNGRFENLAGGSLIFDGEGDIAHWNSGVNAISNAGLVIRRGAGTTLLTSVPFNNLTGGTLRIEAGAFQPAGGFSQSGSLEGSGAVLSSFTNNGTLRPDPVPGGLRISGDLTQGTAGRIELALGSRDAVLEHRSLTITGSASLGGTLAVSLDEASFVEPQDSVFEVVRFGAVVGNFAATEGLTGNFGYTFTPSFTATSLQLAVAVAGGSGSTPGGTGFIGGNGGGDPPGGDAPGAPTGGGTASDAGALFGGFASGQSLAFEVDGRSVRTIDDGRKGKPTSVPQGVPVYRKGQQVRISIGASGQLVVGALSLPLHRTGPARNRYLLSTRHEGDLLAEASVLKGRSGFPKAMQLTFVRRVGSSKIRVRYYLHSPASSVRLSARR
jgi:hypothetical protein